ncbi:TPA: adhesin, partial [Streptococcus pyogenes]|nr:adhesin [Streptococcus pyogenes]
ESKGAATEIEKPEMSISEIINPLLPKNKIKVNNLEKLTEKEKEEIKNKIKDLNKNNFPKNTQVEVDEKGNVSVTYPDKSKDMIDASDLVEKVAQAQNNKTDAQNNPKKLVQNTNLPKTGAGDGLNPFLHEMILGISGLALAITGYFRKKHAK